MKDGHSIVIHRLRSCDGVMENVAFVIDHNGLGVGISLHKSAERFIRKREVTQKDLVHLNESDFRFKIFCACDSTL